MIRIILFLCLPAFWNAQKAPSPAKIATVTDSTGQRPDISKIGYDDIRWAKSAGNVFWFYYKPTQYFFKSNEFETILLENNDILVYVHELQRYVLLANYGTAEKEKEYPVEPVANSTSVFLRSDLRGYWIYDKGFRVQNLQVVSVNSRRQYLLKSGFTDKQYMIEEIDFRFGKLNTPIGIWSE